MDLTLTQLKFLHVTIVYQTLSKAQLKVLSSEEYWLSSKETKYLRSFPKVTQYVNNSVIVGAQLHWLQSLSSLH